VRLRVLLDGMLILTLLVDLQYNWKSATATYKQPYLISYHTITQLLDCTPHIISSTG